MSEHLLSIAGPLVGVVVGATLTWALNHASVKRTSRLKNVELATVLLGELRRIQSHYGFVSGEINATDWGSDTTKYRRMVYGEIRSLESGFLSYGFLGGKAISDILELSFLIRNFDFGASALAEKTIVRPGNILGKDSNSIDLTVRAQVIIKFAHEIELVLRNTMPLAAKILDKRE